MERWSGGISAGPNSVYTEHAPANDRRTEMKQNSTSDTPRTMHGGTRTGALPCCTGASSSFCWRMTTKRQSPLLPMEARADGRPFEALVLADTSAHPAARFCEPPACGGRRCEPGLRPAWGGEGISHDRIVALRMARRWAACDGRGRVGQRRLGARRSRQHWEDQALAACEQCG